MSRRRLLTDEQSAQLYAEYQAWLANAPTKLAARYGLSESSVHRYGRREHKGKLTILDGRPPRRRKAA